MTLRLGIPIFVQPAVAVSPALSGELTQVAQDLKLQIVNGGLAHARLIEALFLDAHDAVLAKSALSRDVLAGQQRTFVLDAKPGPLATRVHIRTDPASAELEFALPNQQR